MSARMSEHTAPAEPTTCSATYQELSCRLASGHRGEHEFVDPARVAAAMRGSAPAERGDVGPTKAIDEFLREVRRSVDAAESRAELERYLDDAAGMLRARLARTVTDAGSRDKDTPEGYRCIAPNVYVGRGEIIVRGMPSAIEDENDPAYHNCDAMGCGWDHVLYRAKLTAAPDAGSAGGVDIEQRLRYIEAELKEILRRRGEEDPPFISVATVEWLIEQVRSRATLPKEPTTCEEIVAEVVRLADIAESYGDFVAGHALHRAAEQVSARAALASQVPDATSRLLVAAKLHAESLVSRCTGCNGDGTMLTPFDGNCPAAWAHRLVRPSFGDLPAPPSASSDVLTTAQIDALLIEYGRKALELGVTVSDPDSPIAVREIAHRKMEDALSAVRVGLAEWREGAAE